MKRFNSFRPINIFRLEVENWEYELHNHNFYELIFVEEGSGIHQLNQVDFDYKKMDVLFLTPNDAHKFLIKEKTSFIYLKFTEQFASEKLNQKGNFFWKEIFKMTLIQQNNTENSIVNQPIDKASLHALLKIMITEFNAQEMFKEEVIEALFGSVMILIMRNLNPIACKTTVFSKKSEKINSILSYIRIHALDNDKMKLNEIAEKFSMSKTYISQYVKKHSGLSIQQHCIQTKLKLSEKMLEQKHFNINEIAEKLGFIDASHFNKIFKKYKNMNPSKFPNH